MLSGAFYPRLKAVVLRRRGIKIFPRDLDVEAMVKIHPGDHLAVGGKKVSLDLETEFFDPLERVERFTDKDLRRDGHRLRSFRAADVVKEALPDPGPAFLILRAGIDRNELGPPPEVTPSFVE